jgi:hypothetical protein
MTLLDHFHPPVSQRRSWEGFHGLWAAAIVEQLNRDVLAEEYFADMQVHVGSRVEVDVATLTDPASDAGRGPGPSGAGTALRVWAPPAADASVPVVFPDEIEVQVFSTSAGATLVAAIELVSPGNKDRPEVRRAFAAKCSAYLTRGVGLIVVDVVTNRSANLHNDLIRLLGRGEPFLMPEGLTTYAVAYRPSRRGGDERIDDRVDLWRRPLEPGQPLPVLPLALCNAGVVPLDLDLSYAEARRRSRLV